MRIVSQPHYDRPMEGPREKIAIIGAAVLVVVTLLAGSGHNIAG